MSKLPFADLHVHSFFSDGTFSPQEILKIAENCGVGLLAVADHDTFEGSLKLCGISDKSEVECVPAAEITCFENGHQVHVLCYRPDLTNADFTAFVAEGRKKLDMMSVRLIDKMERSGIGVSIEEFDEFEYDRSGGGWKALHYFIKKRLIDTLFDGFPLYDIYGCGYETAGFPSVKTAIEKIHSANGIAVIAHPGVSIQTEDKKLFLAELRQFLAYGADGVECFYPEHSEEITGLCERLCDEKGLLKTCGSDCHGLFNSHPLGVPRKEISSLRLEGIIHKTDKM